MAIDPLKYKLLSVIKFFSKTEASFVLIVNSVCPFKTLSPILISMLSTIPDMPERTIFFLFTDVAFSSIVSETGSMLTCVMVTGVIASASLSPSLFLLAHLLVDIITRKMIGINFISGKLIMA